MENNTSGRKKHLVEGTVETITRGEEVLGEAVEDAKETLGQVAETVRETVSEAVNGAGRAQATKKKGFFAKILEAFKK
ncbi:MAG: hypothetical protein IJM15_04500 [Erysipelotrichaceae bacterium]|nr:hypothetical protein [Erysipelotrichaceae bacterium]